jgi:hypothetical protein
MSPSGSACSAAGIPGILFYLQQAFMVKGRLEAVGRPELGQVRNPPTGAFYQAVEIAHFRAPRLLKPGVITPVRFDQERLVQYLATKISSARWSSAGQLRVPGVRNSAALFQHLCRSQLH